MITGQAGIKVMYQNFSHDLTGVTLLWVLVVVGWVFGYWLFGYHTKHLFQYNWYKNWFPSCTWWHKLHGAYSVHERHLHVKQTKQVVSSTMFWGQLVLWKPYLVPFVSTICVHLSQRKPLNLGSSYILNNMLDTLLFLWHLIYLRTHGAVDLW